MTAANAYCQRTGRTAKLCHSFNRPIHNFVQYDLRVMLMKNTICLRTDRRSSSKHQNMKANNIIICLANKDRRRLYPRAVRVKAAALIDSVTIVTHDTHRATRQLSEAFRNAFLYCIKHSPSYRTVLPYLKHQMRYA